MTTMWLRIHDCNGSVHKYEEMVWGGGLERWRIVHEVRGLVDVNVSSWGEGKV